jgi:hypothetical protein
MKFSAAPSAVWGRSGNFLETPDLGIAVGVGWSAAVGHSGRFLAFGVVSRVNLDASYGLTIELGASYQPTLTIELGASYQPTLTFGASLEDYDE